MKKQKKTPDQPCLRPAFGSPDTIEDLLNKYGTYEVQDTADTENEFPAIAQGLGKKKETP